MAEHMTLEDVRDRLRNNGGPFDWSPPNSLMCQLLADAIDAAIADRDAMAEEARMSSARIQRLVEGAGRLIAERDVAWARIDSAPLAIMDTRDALGICATTEEGFPALYALQGKRVRLVVEGE
jgi:hypothetical protein